MPAPQMATLIPMVPADESEITSTEVGRLLQISVQSVHDIPRNRLPYRETPGGLIRRGRRFYLRADVERLAEELKGETTE